MRNKVPCQFCQLARHQHSCVIDLRHVHDRDVRAAHLVSRRRARVHNGRRVLVAPVQLERLGVQNDDHNMDPVAANLVLHARVALRRARTRALLAAPIASFPYKPVRAPF